jgi:hypothetical protein
MATIGTEPELFAAIAIPPIVRMGTAAAPPMMAIARVRGLIPFAPAAREAAHAGIRIFPLFLAYAPCVKARFFADHRRQAGSMLSKLKSI